jgi:hypothetical protein
LNNKHALILLGCRGSGKDTLAAEFEKQSEPGSVRNCKFSELTKSLVSAAFGVPRADLEDKYLRTSPVNPELMGNLTTLDLLDSLYHALFLERPSCRRLKEANVKFTIELAHRTTANLLVFTDIRRIEEANAVLSNFSYTAVHLHRKGATPSPTDNGIDDVSYLLEAHHLRITEREQPFHTYTRLSNLLKEKN